MLLTAVKQWYRTLAAEWHDQGLDTRLLHGGLQSEKLL